MDNPIVPPVPEQPAFTSLPKPNDSDLAFAAFIVGLLMAESCIEVSPEFKLSQSADNWQISMRIVSGCLAHFRQHIEKNPTDFVNSPLLYPFGGTRG